MHGINKAHIRILISYDTDHFNSRSKTPLQGEPKPGGACSKREASAVASAVAEARAAAEAASAFSAPA